MLTHSAPSGIASRASFALTKVSSSTTAPAVQSRHVARRQVTPVCMGRKAAKVAKKKVGVPPGSAPASFSRKENQPERVCPRLYTSKRFFSAQVS